LFKPKKLLNRHIGGSGEWGVGVGRLGLALGVGIGDQYALSAGSCRAVMELFIGVWK